MSVNLPIGVQDVLHRIQSALPLEVTGLNPSGLHVFEIDGQCLAYDGASGALHWLDGVGKAVVLHLPDNPSLHVPFQPGDGPKDPPPRSAEVPASLIRALEDRFSHAQIAEAWGELREALGVTMFAPDETLRALSGEDENPSPIEAGPKSMCLDIAHDCNLSCRYCFASQGSFGGEASLMGEDVGKAAIDWLIEASKDRKYLDVDFFGGEPLLAFDTVKAVLLHALREGPKRGKEFRFTLTTNCTLLDEGKLAFLADHGVSLILSLDGRSEIHDRMRPTRGGQPTYSVAVRQARAAVEAKGGKDYFIRGTYTKHNLDFDEDVRSLYAEGFRRLSLEPAVGEGSWGLTREDLPAAAEAYARLVRFWLDCHDRNDPFDFYHLNLGLHHGLCRERRVTGCGAGYEYVAVTPQGEIFPCHQLVGRSEYSLGDIRDGLKRTDLMKRFYQARLPRKPACVSCWARYLCGGGCHARAVYSTGDLLKPDPLSCEFMKTRLEYALYAQYLLSNGGRG